MPQEPPVWREAHHIGDAMLHLTPDELQELGTRISELIRSYDRGERDGTRPVTALYAAFPRS
jgi:hypothetical protein